MDTFLKLIDFFIKLLDRRHETKTKYFKQYVKPAFEAAQIVFEDYLRLLHSIRRMIETGDNIEDIIKFLEDGRMKYLPLRMKLRAVVIPRLLEADHVARFSQEGPRPPIRRLDTDGLTTFERGIAGVMRGGLAPFEDGYYFSDRYSEMALELGSQSRHTLLDLLYILSDNSLNERRDQLIERVGEQIRAIEMAWEDVVSGYAKLEREAIVS